MPTSQAYMLRETVARVQLRAERSRIAPVNWYGKHWQLAARDLWFSEPEPPRPKLNSQPTLF